MRSIAGWKTGVGCLMVATGGIMYISALWCPVLIDRVSIGVVIFGAALAFYGYCNRFNRVFYSIDEKGKPDLKRSRLKARRLAEGDLS